MFLVYLLMYAAAASAHAPVVSLNDLERFPGKEKDIDVVADDGLVGVVKVGGIDRWVFVADQHWEFCKKQLEMRSSPWIDWQTLVDDAYKTSQAWKWLDEAQGSEWLPGSRLMALGELRRIIGEEYYWSGRMPVPQTWHVGFIP